MVTTHFKGSLCWEWNCERLTEYTTRKPHSIMYGSFNDLMGVLMATGQWRPTEQDVRKVEEILRQSFTAWYVLVSSVFFSKPPVWLQKRHPSQRARLSCPSPSFCSGILSSLEKLLQNDSQSSHTLGLYKTFVQLCHTIYVMTVFPRMVLASNCKLELVGCHGALRMGFE